ncbi:hypothetical protein [Streptomyces sp. Tue6028]|uniref:hypothetical protein n=1 Tax=Streptomyces sp. Tue6028 TaxID=2036037 RepID=UPI003D70B6A3
MPTRKRRYGLTWADPDGAARPLAATTSAPPHDVGVHGKRPAVPASRSSWSSPENSLNQHSDPGTCSASHHESSHPSEVRSLLWEFETQQGPGEAYLHQDGTCLYMDVWQADAVRLAIAFRELAPADLDVVFCDQGYTFDVQLRAGTTEAELTDLVNAAD